MLELGICGAFVVSKVTNLVIHSLLPRVPITDLGARGQEESLFFAILRVLFVIGAWQEQDQEGGRLC